MTESIIKYQLKKNNNSHKISIIINIIITIRKWDNTIRSKKRSLIIRTRAQTSRHLPRSRFRGEVNEPSSGRKLPLRNSGKRCVKFDGPRSNDRSHAPFVLITVPRTILSIIRFDINERDLSFVSAVARARRSYFSSLSCGAALRKSYGSDL